MEKSIKHIEQTLEQSSTDIADQGLDNQSFFYASEQPNTKQITIPTKYIMMRMLRVE